MTQKDRNPAFINLTIPALAAMPARNLDGLTAAELAVQEKTKTESPVVVPAKPAQP